MAAEQELYVECEVSLRRRGWRWEAERTGRSLGGRTSGWSSADISRGTIHTPLVVAGLVLAFFQAGWHIIVI